jgi:riboflavin biosynthesis pyrimidine reductase
MREFQILFDDGETSEVQDPAYSAYGNLGFPAAPVGRPWVYANFVQTLDGIVSLLGVNASGGDIAQSEEDRWLMDLLRAHADAVLLGMGTLMLEKRRERPRPRGPVFRIVEPALQRLRAKLGRGAERNIFVSATGNFQLADFAVFDGDRVESAVVTTVAGAQRLKPQQETHPHVKIMVAGEGSEVDLKVAMRVLRQEMGIRYLLCEGGPVLYGHMIRAGLVDEKFLTVAPVDAGQEIPPEQEVVPWKQPAIRPTIFSGMGFSKENVVRWHWVSCRRVGDLQFNRYRAIGKIG